MITVGFHQTLTFWRAEIRRPERKRESSICYLRLSDGAIERRHGEAITVWTHAKLQAPEQIQGKFFYTYHDSIQTEKKVPW